MNILHIIDSLFRTSYWFLFLAVVIEGPISTFVAGSIVALGHFSFWLTYLVVVSADVTGDIILYCIGRFGRRGVQSRIGVRMGITPQRLLIIEEKVSKHPVGFIITGKISHGVGGGILMAAGVVKMPFRKFLSISFLSTMVKSLIILGLGYYFGNTTLPVLSYLRYLALISFVLIIFFTWRFGQRYLKDA